MGECIFCKIVRGEVPADKVYEDEEYLAFLEATYMFQFVRPFSKSPDVEIRKAKKVYCIDHGFCNFIGFNLSKNYGRIYENIVCIELLRKSGRI